MATALQHVAWEPCLIEPRPDREIETYARPRHLAARVQTLTRTHQVDMAFQEVIPCILALGTRQPQQTW